MSIEIELRARFDQDKHNQLLGYLHKHGEDLGVNNKHLFLYVLPDKLLKVVENLSAGTAKISLKTNKIGQGSAFPEIEMDISPAVVETAIQIFNNLGFSDARHEAFNERHDFRYKNVEIAMKHSEAWGHHAEFEILLHDSATESEKADAVARIHQVAEELGVRLMTEHELVKFTEEFEQTQATQA